MKIVVAPNSFKDCLSAAEVAAFVESGIRRVLPDAEVVKVPVSDGGDGLLESLLAAGKGKIIKETVHDPLFRKIKSEFVYFPDEKTALIEMARASGLALLKQRERNPLHTSTYGTGELILKALDKGAEKILLGIGGSATNEGGIGILSALGAVFYDEGGCRLKPVGGSLDRIHEINLEGLDDRIAGTGITIICDVTNPLLGKYGATAVFGPQKGAGPEEIDILEKGLSNLAGLIKGMTGRDIRKIQGGGAAGGIGAVMHGLFNVSLKRGIDAVIEFVGLEEKIRGAALVITGEGFIDDQTLFGKAPAGVALLSGKSNIPCVAIAGGIGGDLHKLYEAGFTSVFSICRRPSTLQESIKGAGTLIEYVSEQVMRLFMVNGGK